MFWIASIFSRAHLGKECKWNAPNACDVTDVFERWCAGICVMTSSFPSMTSACVCHSPSLRQDRSLSPQIHPGTLWKNMVYTHTHTHLINMFMITWSINFYYKQIHALWRKLLSWFSCLLFSDSIWTKLFPISSYVLTWVNKLTMISTVVTAFIKCSWLFTLH